MSTDRAAVPGIPPNAGGRADPQDGSNDASGEPDPGARPVDRAATFAAAAGEDRAALFAAGPTPIPRRAVVIALCAVLVLGGGGTLLEHVFSGAGLNPRKPATAAPTTVAPALPAPTAPLPGTASRPPVTAPLPAFMGLETPTPKAAPPVDLVDQDGLAWSLGAWRGSVVVLSFFDGPCNDICPVLATEIRQADGLLGARSSGVQFVTVNTDPDALAAGDLAPATAAAGLGSMPNWHMVTGPLPTLNSVWHDYGITITANTVTKAVAHNELLYFIDPQGRIRYRATPFADEQADGTYTLSPADRSRWSAGIATYAARLLPGP